MKKDNLITRVYPLLCVPIILSAVIASVSVVILPLYAAVSWTETMKTDWNDGFFRQINVFLSSTHTG